MFDITPELHAILDKLSEASLRSFACDCASRMLPVLEDCYPVEKRPQIAIDTARAYARNQATLADLDRAMEIAETCAWDLALDETHNYASQACGSIAITAKVTCSHDPHAAVKDTISMVHESLSIATIGGEHANSIWDNRYDDVPPARIKQFKLAHKAEYDYQIEQARTYLDH
jgi:hypothetical protein